MRDHVKGSCWALVTFLTAAVASHPSIVLERSVCLDVRRSDVAECNYSGEIVLAAPTTFSTLGRYYDVALQNSVALSMVADHVNTRRCGVHVGGMNYSLQLQSVDHQSSIETIAEISGSLRPTADLLSKANFVVAPYSSTLTAQMMAVLSNATLFPNETIPVLAPGAASTEVVFSRYGGEANGNLVFGTLPPASTYARSSLQALASVGAKTVAYVTEPSVFPMAICEGVNATHAAANGFEVVNRTVISLSPTVDELVEVFRPWKDGQRPDVVLGCVHVRNCQVLVKALRKLNYAPPSVLLPSCVGFDALVSDLGLDLAYIMGPSLWHRSITGLVDPITGWSAATFEDEFKRRLLQTPYYQAASAGAALSVLVQAIERIDSLDGDDVRKSLQENVFETFYAPSIEFDALGQASLDALVLQYPAEYDSNGMFEVRIVAGTDTIVYPIPSWEIRDCIHGNNCSGRGICQSNGSCFCEEGYEAIASAGDAACVRDGNDKSEGGGVDIALLVVIILFVGAGALFLGVGGSSVRRVIRRMMKQSAQRERDNERKVARVFDCLRKLDFPAALISAESFAMQGRLVQHEYLRDTGGLVFLDSLDDVEAFRARTSRKRRRIIVFFSHQWTCFDAPDPTNSQYKTMLKALRFISKDTGFPLSNIYVWVDFCSIPQRARSIQSLAILSLSAYASAAHYFVVVAPTTKHSNLDVDCTIETYADRMWCRAEQACFVLRNGTQRMYLATERGVEHVSSYEKWLSKAFRVFDGELTCCRLKHPSGVCDRQQLLFPILGLYAELLYRDKIRAKKETHGMFEAKSSSNEKTGDSEDDQSKLDNVRVFLDEIALNKEILFPTEFTLDTESTSVSMELFGDLVERIENEVDALARDPDARKRGLTRTRRHRRDSSLINSFRYEPGTIGKLTRNPLADETLFDDAMLHPRRHSSTIMLPGSSRDSSPFANGLPHGVPSLKSIGRFSTATSTISSMGSAGSNKDTSRHKSSVRLPRPRWTKATPFASITITKNLPSTQDLSPTHAIEIGEKAPADGGEATDVA